MIITLTGQNSFQRIQELNKLQQKFVQEHGPMGLERLQGEDLEMGRLLDLLQAGNLFVPERLVVVRDLSQNKPIAEKIDEILQVAATGVTLVLHEPTLDMRTSYAKTLQKQTDFRKFDEVRDFQLTGWLVDEAKQRGGSIARSVADNLIRRVGASQQLLSLELDKLIAYDPEVTNASVELLCEPSVQTSIFELLAAAFEGNQSKMLKLYREQRSQNMEPQAILSMVAWQLHVFLAVKAGGKRSSDDIAKQAGLSPYVVKNSLSIAHRLSLAHLKDLAKRVIDLEIAMKSKAIDVDDAVQTLLLHISTQ